MEPRDQLLIYIRKQAALSPAERDAIPDPVTGLRTRGAFDHALFDEVERANRLGSDVGLVLLDLDNFKNVNDTYGIPQGDVVLREVARVLQANSHEIGTTPARYGGEEFAIVLPDTGLDGAFNRAERIRDEIARLRIARLDRSGTLSITTSCGVTAAHGTAADGHALVRAADRALYDAKSNGKNRTVRREQDAPPPGQSES